ncbi:Uncharacterised protein g8056 [Pycnogonum litorale]
MFGQSSKLKVECCEEDIAMKQTLPPITTKQIVLAILVISGNVIISAAFSVIATFFPETAMKKGATQTEVGFIFSVFSICTIVLSPFVGKILPKIGEPLFFLLSTSVVSIVHLLIAFLVDLPDGAAFISSALILRAIAGIGNVAYKAATYNILSSKFPGRVATLMGCNAGAFGLGVSMGPLIGGFFYDIGGFRAPLYFMAGSVGAIFIAMFVTFRLIGFVKENEVEVSAGEQRRMTKNCLGIYSVTALYVPLYCITTSQLINAFLDMSLGDHSMREFGLSATAAGAMFIGFQAPFSIICPIVGYIVDKKHYDEQSMGVGLMVLFVSYQLLGPAPYLYIPSSIWLTQVSLLLGATGLAMVFIPAYKVLNRITIQNGYPDNLATKSKISAVYLTSMGIGQFVGPSMGGIVIDYLNFQWASCVVAYLCGLSSVVMIIHLLRKRHRNNAKETTPLIGKTYVDTTCLPAS